jgi:hypothetical protein
MGNCVTTTHWATHISAECATGGTGQCDGHCESHRQECTCSCHNDLNLPQTVAEVRDWHDDLNNVLASFEKGTDVEQWSEATNCRERVRAWHNENTQILPGQGRVVIVERY